MLPRRLLSRALPLALAASVLGAAPAVADVETRFLEAPREATVGSAEHLVYRLELRAGDEAVRVRVDAMANARFGDEHARPEGMPVSLDGLPQVSGDGVEESAHQGWGIIACAPSGGAYHGLEPHGAGNDIWIPARGVAVVTSRWVVSDTPRWPRTDYRPLFRVQGYEPFGADGIQRPADGTVEWRNVPAPALEVSGPRGVRLFMDTDPVTNERAGSHRPVVAAGSVLAVRGETEPALSGGTVLLRYDSASTDGQRDLAAVALDDAGRFDYRGWRPGESDYTELWGYVDPPAATGLRPDHFCPRAFAVEGSAANVAGHEAAVFEARVQRRRRAVVVVGCSGPVGGQCSGRVAVRAGRRRAGMKAFALASGSRGPVTVRLRRRVKGPLVATVTGDGLAPVTRPVRRR